MTVPVQMLPRHHEHMIQLIDRANILPQQNNIQEQGLSLAFPGNAIAVREALADTIAALRILDLAGEEYGTIELVLAEVLNNIVEHAYADNQDGMIELEIVPKPNGLCCKLRDGGHPMPDGNVPLGNLPPSKTIIDDLPEGGFGWFLIRDLARDLQYTRSNGKNNLTFRIAVGQQRFQPN